MEGVVDEVLIRVIPETQARLAELDTGIDIANEIDTAMQTVFKMVMRLS